MGRHITTNYQLDVPDHAEDPDVAADFIKLADRVDVVIGGVDVGRSFFDGTGAPAGALGNDNDIYFELP